MIKDLFAFFGVDPSGTPEQVARKVKRAYRKMVLLHHPDRGGDPAEFLKVQGAYDKFKASGAPRAAPTPQQPTTDTRAAVTLFKEFCLFISAHHDFSRSALEALANDPDEMAWLEHFVFLGRGAGFLTGRTGYVSVVFLGAKMTLPRYYRAWALNSLPTSHPLFRDISRMFCGDAPWNYHYLRDSVRGV